MSINDKNREMYVPFCVCLENGTQQRKTVDLFEDGSSFSTGLAGFFLANIPVHATERGAV
jgi:hypothetical protein